METKDGTHTPEEDYWDHLRKTAQTQNALVFITFPSLEEDEAAYGFFAMKVDDMVN